MRILSWNIQSGLGADGVRSLDRVIERIRLHGPPEVICLQEVACHFPEYCDPRQPDQRYHLQDAFPDHAALWAFGMRWHRSDAPPQEFGNLTLVSTDLLSSRIHSLPLPAGEGLPQLPRALAETVIQGPAGPLRILNTHLAYHNPEERRLQLDYVRHLQQWIEDRHRNPPDAGTGAYNARHSTPHSVLCGDLNLTPESDAYRFLAGTSFRDAWDVFRPGHSQPATCGVHDHDTWPAGPHCRDYFWLTSGLAGQVQRFEVDRETDASDHQPIVLTLKPQ